MSDSVLSFSFFFLPQMMTSDGFKMNLKEITSVTLKKSKVVYKLKKGDIVLFRRQQHETLNKLVKYFNAKA